MSDELLSFLQPVTATPRILKKVEWVSESFSSVLAPFVQTSEGVQIEINNVPLLVDAQGNGKTIYVSGLGSGVDNLYTEAQYNLTDGARAGQGRLTLLGVSGEAAIGEPNILAMLGLDIPRIEPRIYTLQTYLFRSVDALPFAAGVRYTEARIMRDRQRDKALAVKTDQEAIIARQDLFFANCAFLEAILQMPVGHFFRPMVFNPDIERIVGQHVEALIKASNDDFEARSAGKNDQAGGGALKEPPASPAPPQAEPTHPSEPTPPQKQKTSSAL